MPTRVYYAGAWWDSSELCSIDALEALNDALARAFQNNTEAGVVTFEPSQLELPFDLSDIPVELDAPLPTQRSELPCASQTHGRKEQAPCGHQGEVVIGRYVSCDRCDGVPEYVDREITAKICAHNRQRSIKPIQAGRAWCIDCCRQVACDHMTRFIYRNRKLCGTCEKELI